MKIDQADSFWWNKNCQEDYIMSNTESTNKIMLNQKCKNVLKSGTKEKGKDSTTNAARIS